MTLARHRGGPAGVRAGCAGRRARPGQRGGRAAGRHDAPGGAAGRGARARASGGGGPAGRGAAPGGDRGRAAGAGPARWTRSRRPEASPVRSGQTGSLSFVVLGRVDDPAEPLPGGLARDAQGLADLRVGDVPLADPADPHPQVAVHLARGRGDQRQPGEHVGVGHGVVGPADDPLAGVLGCGEGVGERRQALGAHERTQTTGEPRVVGATLTAKRA